MITEDLNAIGESLVETPKPKKKIKLFGVDSGNNSLNTPIQQR